jgi:hypothetical protein
MREEVIFGDRPGGSTSLAVVFLTRTREEVKE